MKRSLLKLATVTLLLCPSLGVALEGKWTPQQLVHLDREWLAREGLAVDPRLLWDEATGSGLLSAVVEIDGCTAVLVSPDGLLATNHHCVTPILQQHSKPGFDILTGGFLAADRAAELAGTLKARILQRQQDVTARVEAAAAGAADASARARAIERARKDLVASCERASGHRCRVAACDDGVQYLLLDALEYPDLRLVYAPPEAVGSFGGEEDNWTWPRHTADFAFLRIWTAPDGRPARAGKGSTPLRSPQALRLTASGVAPEELVLLAGYPARSYRSLTAAEMGERAALYFPQRLELYGTWQRILEEASAGDEQTRIALAERLSEVANDTKNARGQVEGLSRGNLVERKWAFESQVLAWARERPDLREAVAAYEELALEVARRRATWRRDFLLESMTREPQPMAAALTLVRWARERTKADLDRQPAFMERNREALWERLTRQQLQVHGPTEKALLTALLERIAELAPNARSAAVDRFLGGATGHDAVAGRVDKLFVGTRVLDGPSLRAMFDENLAGLRLRRDSLLELAIAVDDELARVDADRERWAGVVSQLRPRWQRAVQAFLGKPVSPDANGTLRVTVGHVRGYAPRDGVALLPQTRLAGLLEKDRGAAPFLVPPPVRAAAARAAGSRWVDHRLGDVPLAFLADLDTTSGTSGAPVLNGRGELVGLNFDRVWENVANDFGFVPELCRNVSLDARFIGWYLAEVEGTRAAGLLSELGLPR